MATAFNPVGFDWSKGAQNIGGTIFAPQMGPAYARDEAGNIRYDLETGQPALLMEGAEESATYVMEPKNYIKYNAADHTPGGSYEVYDLSGKLLGRDAFTKDQFSRGFFGDLFSHVATMARDTAPVWLTALGANYLAPLMAGGAEAAGAAAAGGGAGASTVGITGAEAAAMGAFDAAAAAPAAVNALAAPAVNTLAAPAATQLTPAALEAAIGTPGYGYNAAAAASGITPSAGFAGMSAADFGVSGAQTTAYDTAMAAGAAPEAAAAAANAAPGIGAPGATAATSAAASAAARGATAVDPYSFIIPAASSIIGGVMSANAAENAAEASGAAADRATALQQRIYEESVARQQPFLRGGTEDYNRLRSLTSGGPEAAQNFLTMDPGYGFRFSEGLKALERSAAARGGLLSGGTGKALTRYGQEAASQEYGNAYNRLARLADVGPQAAGVMSTLGQNYANNVGNITMGQGNTAANALLSSGSAYQRSAGDIASLYARMYGPQPTYLMPGGGG
jgi:hypothetical protein